MRLCGFTQGPSSSLLLSSLELSDTKSLRLEFEPASEPLLRDRVAVALLRGVTREPDLPCQSLYLGVDSGCPEGRYSVVVSGSAEGPRGGGVASGPQSALQTTNSHGKTNSTDLRFTLTVPPQKGSL